MISTQTDACIGDTSLTLDSNGRSLNSMTIIGVGNEINFSKGSEVDLIGPVTEVFSYGKIMIGISKFLWSGGILFSFNSYPFNNNVNHRSKSITFVAIITYKCLN